MSLILLWISEIGFISTNPCAYLSQLIYFQWCLQKKVSVVEKSNKYSADYQHLLTNNCHCLQNMIKCILGTTVCQKIATCNYFLYWEIQCINNYCIMIIRNEKYPSYLCILKFMSQARINIVNLQKKYLSLFVYCYKTSYFQM